MKNGDFELLASPVAISLTTVSRRLETRKIKVIFRLRFLLKFKISIYAYNNLKFFVSRIIGFFNSIQNLCN